MRIGSRRSLVRRFRESIRGTRGGRSSCLGLGGKRRHRRRGGGNVEIAPYCDFQGRWDGSENLPLVFLAFHGPPFPRSTSGPSTLTRPSLVNVDRRFYPRLTAKNMISRSTDSDPHARTIPRVISEVLSLGSKPTVTASIVTCVELLLR